MTRKTPAEAWDAINTLRDHLFEFLAEVEDPALSPTRTFQEFNAHVEDVVWAVVEMSDLKATRLHPRSSRYSDIKVEGVPI